VFKKNVFYSSGGDEKTSLGKTPYNLEKFVFCNFQEKYITFIRKDIMSRNGYLKI